MQCPFCSHLDTRVVDKRDSDDITRRRRECQKCAKRFSTREAVEWGDFRVVKKDGRIQPFDREKVKLGIVKACEKRPVNSEKIDSMITTIEEKLRKRGREAPTSMIGELDSKELKKVDKVAYIRFASVYQDFTNLEDFKKEIKGLIRN